jgi:hypothetical protein
MTNKKKNKNSNFKSQKIYAEVKSPYLQKSIKKRIEFFFLDNIGKVARREQICYKDVREWV